MVYTQQDTRKPYKRYTSEHIQEQSSHTTIRYTRLKKHEYIWKAHKTCHRFGEPSNLNHTKQKIEFLEAHALQPMSEHLHVRGQRSRSLGSRRVGKHVLGNPRLGHTLQNRVSSKRHFIPIVPPEGNGHHDKQSLGHGTSDPQSLLHVDRSQTDHNSPHGGHLDNLQG